ncbi:MAG TPA: hypothetical protein VGW34_11755 [Allosphingosinicella sp.]|nr:hypothetical protein [Allosphingosinicella sp.]
MRRLILFAAVAGLGLAAASPPQGGPSSAWPRSAQGGYPPCSRTVTDRCIQLYERGVATPANLALNDRLGGGTAMASAEDLGPAAGRGGPYEPLRYEGDAIGDRPAAAARGGDYPPCSRLVTDRCIQLYERGVRRARR